VSADADSRRTHHRDYSGKARHDPRRSSVHGSQGVSPTQSRFGDFAIVSRSSELAGTTNSRHAESSAAATARARRRITKRSVGAPARSTRSRDAERIVVGHDPFRLRSDRAREESMGSVHDKGRHSPTRVLGVRAAAPDKRRDRTAALPSAPAQCDGQRVATSEPSECRPTDAKCRTRTATNRVGGLLTI
jgi:hypothetical protein